VRSVAIDPRGLTFASSDDGTVRVWDLAAGAEIALYRSEPTAFLSYAREDRPIAERLRRLLIEAGMTVWSDDQISIGSSIAGSIERAIRGSDVIFVVSSSRSSDSPAVNAELAIAIAEQNRNPRKVIIPVLADDEASLSPLLRDRAGLDVHSDAHVSLQLSHLVNRITGLPKRELKPVTTIPSLPRSSKPQR
jgi:hypothetical protein